MLTARERKEQEEKREAKCQEEEEKKQKEDEATESYEKWMENKVLRINREVTFIYLL
jgi:uncharacterized FlaG/YvyC family protein